MADICCYMPPLIIRWITFYSLELEMVPGSPVAGHLTSCPLAAAKQLFSIATLCHQHQQQHQLVRSGQGNGWSGEEEGSYVVDI